MRPVRTEKHDRAGAAHPTERPCNAHGCPEIGSISHSNAGPAPEDSWLCRHHFGEPATRWGEITRALRMGERAGREPGSDDE